MEIQKVNPVPSREQFQIKAADGWRELGNISEALAELDGIHESFQMHPQVALKRFELLCHARKWDEAVSLMQRFAPTFPTCETYLAYAQAIRFQKGPAPALALLAKIESQYPNHVDLHYQMACYCSLLARFEEATLHLAAVISLDTSREFAGKARSDRDLKALRLHLLRGGAFSKLFPDSK